MLHILPEIEHVVGGCGVFLIHVTIPEFHRKKKNSRKQEKTKQKQSSHQSGELVYKFTS